MTGKRLAKKWIIRQHDATQASKLADALGVSKIVAGLLISLAMFGAVLFAALTDNLF